VIYTDRAPTYAAARADLKRPYLAFVDLVASSILLR
jgi:hypothetical protein